MRLELSDGRFGRIEFRAERNGRSEAAFDIPARGGLRLFESFLEVVSRIVTLSP